MKSRFLSVYSLTAILTTAACSDSGPPAATLVPGAELDTGLEGRAVQRVSADLRPCGYDRVENYAPSAPEEAVAYQFRGVFAYDDRGLQIGETAVDGDNAFAHRFEHDFDAMGNLVHWNVSYAHGYSLDAWLVYDSFGRRVRVATDQGGDGTEEYVVTHTYGADRNKLSSHRVRSRGVDDRSFRYDSESRLIEVTQDDGPDGQIDETSRFVYDDIQRTAAMTTTDAAGVIIESSTTYYDEDNHVLLAESSSTRDMVTTAATSTHTYVDGRLISSEETMRQTEPGFGDFTSDIRTQWRYTGCN